MRFTNFNERGTRIYTQAAKGNRLMQGDVIMLKGSSSTQEIELAGGQRKTLNHFSQIEIEVIRLAKLTSITVYEQKRGR